MGMVHRAYSLLTVKAVDDDKRIIEGIATTPTPDRMGDVVEPKGAEFKLPLPFLWQHDSRQPLGHVVSAKVTADGIVIKAQLASIDEPGKLKDRLDEAWQSLKAGLVRGLSIGFRDIESSYMKDTGAFHFLKWEWMELSAVTIPANAEASISAIKSLDQEQRAALGKSLPTVVRSIPGVSGSPKPKALPERATKMSTIAEQISAFEATRAAKAARMEEIQKAAGDDGRNKDAAEKEEFSTLDSEIKAIDDELADLRKIEKMKAAKATPAAGANPAEAADSRAGTRVEVIKRKLPAGVPFVRYLGARWYAQKNHVNAADYASTRWGDSSPEVAAVLRAAVNPGTTTDTTWAQPLVELQNMASEFVEYLRPMTIIGRIDGFRRVPFNIKVPRQTGVASVNWVGETKVKPVSSLAFDQIELTHYKLAGIVALSDQLLMFSSPSAEMIVRDDLAKGIVQLMDQDFVDPTKAEATGVSPASVTYNVTPVTASGTSAAALRTDVNNLLSDFLAANLSPAGGVWIMTNQQALAISLMRTSLDQPEFPGITMMGGTFMGMPVIASENIPSVGNSPVDGSRIIFLRPSEIMLADEGGVNIDVSREASLQMDSTPDSPATASTVLVSLWQHNLTAFRAERTINWKKRRDDAVGYINGAKYAP